MNIMTTRMNTETSDWATMLGANIVRQAFTDWKFDIMNIQGQVVYDHHGGIIPVDRAWQDMKMTIRFVDSGLATTFCGIAKDKLKKRLIEITPKDIVSKLSWGE